MIMQIMVGSDLLLMSLTSVITPDVLLKIY